MKILDEDFVNNIKWKVSDVLDYIKKQFEADVVITQTKWEQMIQDTLPDYVEWVIEGKPENPYYYDPYHDNISYSFKENTGNFNIQIFDSPSVDVWIKGKFKLEDGYVKIIEVSSYRT